MAATAVSIASNALLRLGAETISSFDEADQDGSNIERARLAANLWPTVRQQILRAHLWNCAIKRVMLSPLADTPEFGWGYQFQRPSDWIRTVSVGDDDCDRFNFRAEGGRFLSNEPRIPLVYVFDNDNPATYDASLIGVLELAMAAALAYPVTNSTSLAEAMSQAMTQALIQARAYDAQDEPPQTLGDFPLLQARFGGRHWGR